MQQRLLITPNLALFIAGTFACQSGVPMIDQPRKPGRTNSPLSVPSAEEPEQIPQEEDYTADAPARVGGSYLICVTGAARTAGADFSIGCRLTDKDGQQVESPAGEAPRYDLLTEDGRVIGSSSMRADAGAWQWTVDLNYPEDEVNTMRLSFAEDINGATRFEGRIYDPGGRFRPGADTSSGATPASAPPPASASASTSTSTSAPPEPWGDGWQVRIRTMATGSCFYVRGEDDDGDDEVAVLSGGTCQASGFLVRQNQDGSITLMDEQQRCFGPDDGRNLVSVSCQNNGGFLVRWQYSPDGITMLRWIGGSGTGLCLNSRNGKAGLIDCTVADPLQIDRL